MLQQFLQKSSRCTAKCTRISGTQWIRSFSSTAGPFTETTRDFLQPEQFYNELQKVGMDFWTGVPDSLLKDICAYVSDNASPSQHVITANEGAAVGIGAGYHLATGRFPVVYMQNSGFGNTVNPLLSLADPKVYGIPMLLLIGWRGEPGKKDEPQHLVQGKVMSSLLTDMNIQFEVLPDYLEGAQNAIASAVYTMDKRKAPYAFLVKRQTFTPYSLKNTLENTFKITREEAIKIIVDTAKPFDITVATTGFCARELFEMRAAADQGHKRDFLTVGSMGHASAIALGVAMAKPSREVYCLDGDGAALMHMGSMATVGSSNVSNLRHILLNNGAHESVGGQPTVGLTTKFTDIATACGYKYVAKATTREEIVEKLNELRNTDGPGFLEIFINKGTRSDLGRPTKKPTENKIDFMQFLQG